jgi:hypothetical protein
VRGEVANPRRVRLGPRRFRYHFTIVSRQRVLRVRRRDELQWLADPRLCLVVTDIQRSGSTTRIFVDIVSGQQAVGLPAAGTTMELTKDIPDWTNILRARKQLSERLSTTPWTHRADGTPPRPTPRRSPRDPLAEVEALR